MEPVTTTVFQHGWTPAASVCLSEAPCRFDCSVYVIYRFASNSHLLLLTFPCICFYTDVFKWSSTLQQIQNYWFYVIVPTMKGVRFVSPSERWNKCVYKIFNMKSPVHFIKSGLVLLFSPPWYRPRQLDSMCFLTPVTYVQVTYTTTSRLLYDISVKKNRRSWFVFSLYPNNGVKIGSWHIFSERDMNHLWDIPVS